jgi:type VI secretion system secreted protein Hcp
MSREEANRIARAAERMRRSSRAAKIALPTAAALGAGAAVAIGSIPGSGGTITGCYNTQSIPGATSPSGYGTLRVIDPTLTNNGDPSVYKCSTTEATITWNQQGPQGPQGVTGAIGPQGPPGSIGSQGPEGKTPSDTGFGLSGQGSSYFLKLDGIAGESRDRQHKGEIDVQSFSFGTNSGQGAAGGGGAGKATIGTFTVIKPVDRASPLLFRDQQTAQHLKFATLSLARTHKGTQSDYLKFNFTEVQVNSLKIDSSRPGPAVEEVTFNFHKLVETVNSKSPVSITLDLKALKGL